MLFAKESQPLGARFDQTDAPGMYGTHFIENQPFREYHPAFQFFFQALPKRKQPINLLDAACGNENRVLDGMRQFGRQINLTAVDLIAPSELGTLPKNVNRSFIQADLRNDWQLPDNHFDGVIFSWALHWFGYNGAKTALDNAARVLKPGGDAIITTLTSYDLLIKDSTFLKEKISKKKLDRYVSRWTYCY